MKNWSLRTRLFVLFTVLLVLVQGVGFWFVTTSSRSNATAKIATDFDVGERVFALLLAQNRDRLLQTARVLAADFAFKEALLTHDAATARSALANHGARIGAPLMMLVDLKNRVIADTAPRIDPRRTPPMQPLLSRAATAGSASEIQLLDGEAWQLVVVPVRAPLPVAWLIMGFPVDHALALNLQQVTRLEVSFLAPATPGWRLVTSTLGRARSTALLHAMHTGLTRVESAEGADQVRVVDVTAGEPGQTTPRVVAVLQRSLAEGMAGYERLRETLLGLALLSIFVTLICSAAIALGVTRPLNALVPAALRIENGDYDTAVQVEGRDEIGRLANSLNHMRMGIAEREKRIVKLAFEDALTNLPNRALLIERLDQAIVQAERGGEYLAVIVLDLDRFKSINDSLGHTVGDHVLIEVAARLRGALRAADTVARLGADEFAFVIGIESYADAERVANKLLATLETPILYGEQPLDVGASIGIAHHPLAGSDSATLLRNADAAMTLAKRSRSDSMVWTPGREAHQQDHLSLLGELRRAVERDELRVAYQPKLSLTNFAVVGVEALMRWEHPERGLIPPSEFIPFAEHTGYIKVLTRWVINAALTQCGAWLRDGRELRVAVNISARDLLTRDLPTQIAAALQRHDVPARLLCLEVTESSFMDDPATAERVLKDLHELGIRISIDDYGTGYSSLAYLQRLPVSELKIDRSFVVNASSDAASAKIVRSTIELAHSLGLEVVAEGVEDQAGLDFLRTSGCDLAQGFVIGRPVPAAQLTIWAAGKNAVCYSPRPEIGGQSAKRLANQKT